MNDTKEDDVPPVPGFMTITLSSRVGVTMRYDSDAEGNVTRVVHPYLDDPYKPSVHGVWFSQGRLDKTEQHRAALVACINIVHEALRSFMSQAEKEGLNISPADESDIPTSGIAVTQKGGLA